MKCSFCGKNIMPGTGKIYVKKTGKRYFFCSKKCEKNLLDLGRKPDYLKWTEAGKKQAAAKEAK